MQKKPTYEKNFYINLGKTLKEERMKHNLTQEEVSSILCRDRSQYSRYEGGISSIPLYDLYCLAKFYQVSIELLLGG